MSLQLEQLLRLVADTARQKEPLPPALRASDLPGAAEIADRLEEGVDVATALAEHLPSPLVEMLAGGSPEIAPVAELIAEEMSLRRERRRLLFDHLAYPAVCLVLFCGAGLWIMFNDEVTLALSWLVLLVPALLCSVVLPLLPLVWPAAGLHLPWFCGWNVHLDQAGRYRRAAIAARWRLPEEQLVPLLGDGLAGLGPVLASDGAESYCRDLSSYHAETANRRLRMLLRLVTVGIYLGIGAIALACMGGMLGEYLDTALGIEP